MLKHFFEHPGKILTRFASWVFFISTRLNSYPPQLLAAKCLTPDVRLRVPVHLAQVLASAQIPHTHHIVH
jgi:hypothetical protein